MGTSFDCFDVRSRTDCPEITAEQKRWRALLRAVMDRQAFSNYEREWWHYTRNRARGTVYFDFPIPKR
jgi:D-alanyl-D-alanine dipeptidase